MREEDRERLIRILDYLESEVDDYPAFSNLTWETYQKDKEKRRNVERWIENIVMSSIDMAKILLASENRPIPLRIHSRRPGRGLLVRPQERLDRPRPVPNLISHGGHATHEQ